MVGVTVQIVVQIMIDIGIMVDVNVVVNVYVMIDIHVVVNVYVRAKRANADWNDGRRSSGSSATPGWLCCGTRSA